MRFRRRTLLGWASATSAAAVSTAVLGCDRDAAGGPVVLAGEAERPRSEGERTRGPTAAPPGTASAGPRPDGDWHELELAPTIEHGEPGRVVIKVNPGAPILLALHGAGENKKGLVGGSRGFRDDYDLGRCDGRLRAPPLTEADLLGFVDPGRLAKLNASLAARPYGGLTVACPFTPWITDVAGARRWASWLEQELLPKVRQVAGAPSDAPIGVDGISMGGRLALLLGCARPDLFETFGAAQPAIRPDEVAYFANVVHDAQAQRRRPLRLISSHGDFYLEAIREFSGKLARRKIAHELVVTPGPHDYPWNRGPGCTEMLLWHDRALRGQTPV
ncbi:MAG: esterase [Deltaproteobacteria bacterium]|nr:esterase [Deltaproteobacteria bacterium]